LCKEKTMTAVVENIIEPEKLSIPSSLIYEEMDGNPVYYRGYRDVLSGINYFLGSQINRKKYIIATNESGLHLAKGNNLANDIAIFEKENLKLDNHFFKVAPKIVVEVDIKAEVEEYPAREADYIFEKSQKLIEFGVEKVIWITTQSHKIFIATPSDTWLVFDWAKDVEVMEGVIMNVKKILDEEEIAY
jgi:Uma2 family endonuclease